MKVRALIVIFLTIIFGTAVIVSFYLNISFLQFCLALPWSIIATIFGFLLIHLASNGLDICLLIGGLLNTALFLWIFLLKPLIDKSTEIPD